MSLLEDGKGNLPMIEKFDERSHWIFIPILACLVAIFPLSSLGYLAVRAVVFGSALYFLLYYRSKCKNELKILFVAVALVYNPFFPVYLYDRFIWIMVDLLTAILFASQLKASAAHAPVNEDSVGVGINEAADPPSIDEWAGDWYGKVVQPVHLAIASIGLSAKKISEDPNLGRWFLGYCSGFISYAKDPLAAFGLEESGMWVRQSSWYMFENNLDKLLMAVLSDDEKSKIQVLVEDRLVFDKEWEDGYGCGIRDAEFWRESNKITDALRDRIRES